MRTRLYDREADCYHLSFPLRAIMERWRDPTSLKYYVRLECGHVETDRGRAKRMRCQQCGRKPAA